MRVAALYDVHGNLPALEAVLADPAFARTDVDVDAMAAILSTSGYPDVDGLLRNSFVEPIDPNWVARLLEDRASGA